MIVKKTLILQGFPDVNFVRFLSISSDKFSENNPIFYDIETTGFSADSSFLYLIGVIYYENNQWKQCQWFGETPDEEKDLLQLFADCVSSFSCTIQYNGNRFDQPYLEKKYDYYQLTNPFIQIPSVDIYQKLKPLKKLFGLSGMKQPELEDFLKLSPRVWCDGGECVRIYKRFLKTGDTVLIDTLLGHNMEDLIGLGNIFSLLAFTLLYEETYTISDITLQHDEIIFTLILPVNLPIPLSFGQKGFYFRMENKTVQLLVTLKNHRLQQFYPNYRDYSYIPTEDTVIPKTLSSYMDKELYLPATRKTCYTWFLCNEDFLSNPQKQLQYLKQAIPYFLDFV